VVTLLFFGFILCTAGFNWRQRAFGYEIKLLDPKWMYSPPEVSQLFSTLESGKMQLFNNTLEIDKLNVYAITELTLDLVFPFVYSILLALLTIRLYSAANAKRLILLPIFAALMDISENFTIAYLAFSFDGSPSPVAYLASIFTFLKTALLIISALIVIVGAIASLGKNKYPND
jgi:hypothetical protein